MIYSFGPWSTAFSPGDHPQLSTFWKMRLAMLPLLNQNLSRTTRWTLLVLGFVGIVALAVPTIKWATHPSATDDPGVPVAAIPAGVPAELQKVALSPYRVEPPDIISINSVNDVRLVSDTIRAGEEVIIRASNTLPIDPQGDPVQNQFKTINGPNFVQPDGTVDLGPEYGSVAIEGLTVSEARGAILSHLRGTVQLSDPKVAISLTNLDGKQPICGEHLVRPDGTVSLGIYGSVYVNDMTLEGVKAAIEHHLSTFLHNPQILVDVAAYNSKVVYVISDGAVGQDHQIIRLPYSGNETVLDAMSQVDGMAALAKKNEIWVARPGQPAGQPGQKLPVDWRGITQDAVTATNYQLLPGDRIYVKGSRLKSGRQSSIDGRRAGLVPRGEIQ